MAWSAALERQYWRGELRVFLKWGVWPLIVLAVLTGIPLLLGYPQSAIWWAIMIAAFVAVRRLLAGKDLDSRAEDR